MTESSQILNQLKKADKLARLNMHEFGPHSYQRGIGRLLRTLADHDGATQRELVEELGWSRNYLKDVVKKAEKRELVDLVDDEEPRTYRVCLTDTGKAVLAKRDAAENKAADKILAVLTDEEREQLQTLLDKVVLSAKAEGRICAYGKGRKLHKGHRGHVPHAEM